VTQKDHQGRRTPSTVMLNITHGFVQSVFCEMPFHFSGVLQISFVLVSSSSRSFLVTLRWQNQSITSGLLVQVIPKDWERQAHAHFTHNSKETNLLS